jgi:hypothetical protein
MRKYLLQSNPYYGWYTGRTPEGLQALLGVDWNALVCLLFNAEGEYVRCAEVYFSETGELRETPETGSPFHLQEGVREQLEVALERWVDDVLAAEETIEVLEFHHPDRFIGIAALPSHLEDFVEDPQSIEPEHRARYAESLQRWQASGGFVFWWNEDYYCNPDGTVHSS